MKREEWNEGLNNIDPDIVEKYVEQKDRVVAKKKRKTMAVRIVSAVACLCLVVGVCVGVWGVDSDPEIREYVIYASLTSSSDTSETEIYNEEMEENVTIGNIYEKSFDFYTESDFVNSNAVSSKKISFDGKFFDLTYSKSYKKQIASTKMGDDNCLGKYDSYSFSPGRGCVEFKQGTNDVVFYISHSLDWHSEGTFTASNAEEASREFLTDLYGKKKFEEYTFESCSFASTSTLTGYSVIYRKYIHEYKTEDEIVIFYNMKGELLGINAKYMDYFDQAEKDLKKADIEAAEKALRDSIHESYETNEVATITMDTSGEYYLWIFASRVSPTTGKEEGAKFYINIE